MSVCIIAEIGVNHSGNLGKAMHLMREAKKRGADVAKFQAYDAEELALPGPHRDMLAQYQLTRSDFIALKAEAEIIGIEFMASAFDIWNARMLADMGVQRLKIPSGELTNLPFLSAVSLLDLPLIVSTGMATMVEVRSAANAIGRPVSWLHCASVYPAHASDCNLAAMETLRQGLDAEAVGFSDHTTSLAIPVAAVARGATIIEKHLTLSHDDEGPDHKASMEPGPFAEMVRMIRETEQAIGNGIKKPSDWELGVMPRARRAYTTEGFKRNP